MSRPTARHLTVVALAAVLGSGACVSRPEPVAAASPTMSTPAPRPPTALTAPTTITGNPVTIRMTDRTQGGLIVRGVSGGTANALEVFDYAGNPIAGVAQAGGLWVTGDNFRIFPPGDVFHASLTLHMHGSITVGGDTGPTMYGGAEDPNVVSPCVDQPCHAGDRYLSQIPPYPTLTFDGTTWRTS